MVANRSLHAAGNLRFFVLLWKVPKMVQFFAIIAKHYSKITKITELVGALSTSFNTALHRFSEFSNFSKFCSCLQTWTYLEARFVCMLKVFWNFFLIFSQLRELLTEGVTDENKELLDVSWLQSIFYVKLRKLWTAEKFPNCWLCSDQSQQSAGHVSKPVLCCLVAVAV